MYGPNIKEQLAKGYMNQSEILLSFFEYWCCELTNQKKIFKSHLKDIGAAVCYGHKE